MHGPSVHYLNDVFLKYSLFLVVLGLCCCMSAFSSCREQRLFSSCSAWASVGHVGSIVMAHRHSCPSLSMWHLLGVGIARQIINHRTISKTPNDIFWWIENLDFIKSNLSIKDFLIVIFIVCAFFLLWPAQGFFAYHMVTEIFFCSFSRNFVILGVSLNSMLHLCLWMDWHNIEILFVS